jgi:hypothetical protein
MVLNTKEKIPHKVSLFGESSDVQIAEPIVPPCEDWTLWKS